MRERIKYEPADRDLERYIKIHEPGLADDLPVSDSNRRFFLVMHRQYSQRFHQPPLTTSHKISDLSRQLIASPVMDRLGRHLNGDRSLPWKYAYSALRRKFCVPETEKLRDGGDWDTPQAHAIIRRPEIREELVGWVIGRLIDEGHCPALRALRSPEAGQDAT